MEHVVDDRLRDEAKRFRLVFSCGHCTHFDPDRSRCVLGYPNEPHRSDDLDAREVLSFCKHFELW